MKQSDLFSRGKLLIGMVHLLPLPGTPKFGGSMEEIYRRALEDAERIERGGFQAVMVENFFDIPYTRELSIEQTAALTAVGREVKRSVSIPVGIDAAFSDYKAALSSAMAIEADFVRLAVFVDTVECFAGILEPCAADALRYRKAIGAEHIKILADVQVKHTHMLKDNVSIVESALVAESCMADGIIVTGAGTGQETPIETIQKVKERVKIPVIIGSGVDEKNIKEQLEIADGAIIGSSIKKDGIVSNPVDQTRVEKISSKIK